MAQIGAPACPCLAASAATTAKPEEILKHIAKRTKDVFRIGKAMALALQTGMAVLVIEGSFTLVREHLIGLARLLELLFCSMVAGVFIGMVLHGELAIRFLNFRRRRCLRNT